jgi:hypothetical protein
MTPFSRLQCAGLVVADPAGTGAALPSGALLL